MLQERFQEFLTRRGVVRQPRTPRMPPPLFPVAAAAGVPGELHDLSDMELMSDDLHSDDGDGDTYYEASLGRRPSGFPAITRTNLWVAAATAADKLIRYVREPREGRARENESEESDERRLSSSLATVLWSAGPEWTELRQVMTSLDDELSNVSDEAESNEDGWHGPPDDSDETSDSDSATVTVQLRPETESAEDLISAAQAPPEDPPPRGYLRTRLIHARKMATPSLRKFKNNLSCVVSHNGTDYLIVAVNLLLHIHEFDPTLNFPKTDGIHADIRPPFTLAIDTLVLTWHQFPHTINYLTSSPDFAGEAVVAACVDDAGLLIWRTADLIEGLVLNQGARRTRLHPAYSTKMDSSCWGVDLMTYEDPSGNRHSVIACADNSWTIKLLYYHEGDREFYHVRLGQIGHNIPTVTFVGKPEFLETDGAGSNHIHRLKIACGLISKELVVFDAQFMVVSGPQPQLAASLVYYVDHHHRDVDQPWADRERQDAEIEGSHIPRLSRVLFDEVSVLNRTVLESFVWGVMVVSGRDFLLVASLAEVYGDNVTDPNVEATITTESELLALGGEPDSAHMGLAGLLHYHQRPARRRDSTSSGTSMLNQGADKGYPTYDDQYRRLHKQLGYFYNDLGIEHTPHNPPLKHQNDPMNLTPSFVVCTTNKLMALLLLQLLFCTDYIPQVFAPREIPGIEGQLFSNRLLIFQIVAPLQCCLVATQQGLVQVVRLCHFRGVYGLRLELVLPPPLYAQALGASGFRTIAGLSVRERTVDPLNPAYLVYIVYTDGTVLSFDLGRDTTEEEFFL